MSRCRYWHHRSTCCSRHRRMQEDERPESWPTMIMVMSPPTRPPAISLCSGPSAVAAAAAAAAGVSNWKSMTGGAQTMSRSCAREVQQLERAAAAATEAEQQVERRCCCMLMVLRVMPLTMQIQSQSETCSRRWVPSAPPNAEGGVGAGRAQLPPQPQGTAEGAVARAEGVGAM